MAAAFIANPLGKPFVNHLDCVRSHNKATNLEWCSQLENLRHSDALGRMQRDYWLGKRPPSALLTDDQAREIRRVYSQGNISMEAAGKMFGLSKRAAGRVINRETYADVQ